MDTYDYDGDGSMESSDMWRGLMDLVDLADTHGQVLTLQLSPPYVEYLVDPACNATLGGGREYPVGSGTTYDECLPLVFAWQAAGHEISIHHHGVGHDPLKFDGFSNQAVWDTNGQRPCLSDEDCVCEEGGCFWCAPPESPLVCTEYEDPPVLVGYDPEWRGLAQGPNSMWNMIETILGEHVVTSICMNHQDEAADMPADPDLIYSTQGGGVENDAARFPLCVVHDPGADYHAQPKYVWFYQHELITGDTQLNEVETVVNGGAPETPGSVLGMVFHVNDFVRTELAEAGAPFYHVHRDLLAFLADPDANGDTSDGVPIGTLSGLMVEAGKTSAPDPCAASCVTLDPNSEAASYTVPVPPPGTCP